MLTVLTLIGVLRMLYICFDKQIEALERAQKPAKAKKSKHKSKHKKHKKKHKRSSSDSDSSSRDDKKRKVQRTLYTCRASKACWIWAPGHKLIA